MGYLKRFPINTLKIVIYDSDDSAIITAIIAMFHSLKLKVIAEGVETKEQLALEITRLWRDAGPSCQSRGTV